MLRNELPHRIFVRPHELEDQAWRVSIDGEDEDFVVSGENAASRALEKALALADDLRATGSVLVVVNRREGPPSRFVVRSSLAS